MFTGIVQSALAIKNIEQKPELHVLTIELPEAMASNLRLGASIAVNGTCLTVADIKGHEVSFDVMMETLKVTNLRNLDIGSVVNVERSAKFGDEVGGHIVSGHVHTLANVIRIETPENNCHIRFKLQDEKWQSYLFNKGFISVNGASLTLTEVENGEFSVYLIPETLRLTNFGNLRVGDKVNIEVDPQTQIIVDTLVRMKAQGQLNL